MRGVLFALFIAALPGLALSQTPREVVPEQRVAISRDVDYPGGDLATYFDTTLDACQAACLANPECRAFTFNQRTNACFPKGRVAAVAPYQGAISARIFLTDPALIAAAPGRAAELDFIAEYEFETAVTLARGIGRQHSSDEFSAEDLLAAAAARRASGDDLNAWRFIGAALAVEDRADLWLEYARLGRTMQTDDSGARETARGRAVPALVNAYLRTDNPGLRTTILMEMAEALEAAGRGRDAIPALRLALTIEPRRDAEAALDRVLGLYGFRALEARVESDSAQPRICVLFSEPLARAGVDYAPYVQLPDTAFTVEATGDELCIDGVAHGERYRFLLREGLPAASGETLIRSAEFTQYVRDRSPLVRFPSRAYVLPAAGGAAIPVETVNAEVIDLALTRVSDRNIIRTMQDGQFASPLYPWEEEYFATQAATRVWTGTAEVRSELNREVLTRLPLEAALADQAPGLYVLTAAVRGQSDEDASPATQWFVLSDLGIATMLGTDGLTVVVRGLGDAQAVAGAEVTLVSEANEVLGVAATDAEGVARFEAGLTRGLGAAAPALVTVTQGEDLAFLSLRDAAFDLSDRGVEGRPAPGPIDVFVTTDRGAYRAGETIWLTALMRDGEARAVPGVPLTAILFRPDGVEYSRAASTADAAGGHVFALPVAGSAPRGSWRIEVRADVDAPALARTNVLVEDFLPERIDFDLEAPDTLVMGAPADLTIAARYLFGPPAADLPVEGEVILSVARDVAGWEGWVFGRHDEAFETRIETLDFVSTDADGAVTLPLPLPEAEGAAQPLTATIVVRVSEGSGRPVERRITVPVRPEAAMIGLRPEFEGVVPEGGTARFRLVGLGPDLRPEPMEVVWTVNRVETRYQWYQYGGRWTWEPVTSRQRVATGTATLGDQPVEVSAPVDWGRYEIVVERTGEVYAASSAGFDAGWYAPADAGTTPDFLDLSLDAEGYAVGDTATLRIVPRYPGVALVSVMTNRVISMQTIEVGEGATTLALPVTDEWGTGAYVTASLIRPMDVDAGRNPARALGLAFAPVAPGDRALKVALDLGEARPRSPLEVGVTVGGLSPGEDAYVTLAAVDVGILNLTGFRSPDPQGHYFGQRELGVEMRDLYGQLIDGMSGTLGSVRTGGDGMGQMALQSPPPTEELVAYFTGPLTVGPDGRAEATFDLPAFNGTVRVMAVAWSARAVGQAEAEALVRDPVVVTASVPRFLSPGDTSRLLLEIVHAEGPVGPAALSLGAEGLTLGTGFVPQEVMLTEGGRAVLSVPVTAGAPGLAEIRVVLTTPGGEELERRLRLPVQVNDPEVARTSRFTLEPGQNFRFDDNAFAGMVPGTASAILSVGPLARFDAPGLLATLDRYPYGCTEQVTSQALPLLYFDAVAVAMGLEEGDRIAERIQEAIRAILANQAANGAFGLWGPYSGDLWLDAYVTDFLSRARSRGHAVPEIAFRSAIDNLRNRVNFAADFESGGEDIAYALLVLAREGAAAVGDLRYYVDERAQAFTTPLGSAQLGAALALYGDQLRADAMFRQAQGMLLTEERQGPEAMVWRSDYGTRARDAAAIVTLAAEVGSAVIDRDLLSARFGTVGRPVSTQEAAWALMAVNALVDDLRTAGVTIDGAAAEGPLVRLREDGARVAPVEIANGGTAATDLTVTTIGVPSEPEPAGGNGYAIERSYYTLEGEAADPGRVEAGTRLVAVVTVTPFGRQEARLMVNDPLPAGFEIDNPNLLRGGDIRALDWLDPVRGEHAEFRQDRFLAAVDWRSDRPFRLAYVVRAVSPGEFHHPAASVEDMYRPEMRARTEAGRVTVTSAE